MWGLLSKHTRWLERKVEKYKRRGSKGIYIYIFYFSPRTCKIKVEERLLSLSIIKKERWSIKYSNPSGRALSWIG
jgi:hypothetical protein